MQPHFRSCAKSGFYQLRQLWSVRRSLSTDVAKALAHAFISSRIDYCNSSFYGATAKNLRYLQSVLHGAARMVLRRRKFDHISSGIRDELHWLPVAQRVNFKICLLTYKCLHNMAPLYLANLCVPVDTTVVVHVCVPPRVETSWFHLQGHLMVREALRSLDRVCGMIYLLTFVISHFH